MIGVGLLGLVVLKLVTKDLSGSGTLAGIVSFLVVGALMLLIGFLSPIPAKHVVAETTGSDDAKDNIDPINSNPVNQNFINQDLTKGSTKGPTNE